MAAKHHNQPAPMDPKLYQVSIENQDGSGIKPFTVKATDANTALFDTQANIKKKQGGIYLVPSIFSGKTVFVIVRGWGENRKKDDAPWIKMRMYI